MSRETILVVDDVPDNIDVLAGILREEYRVLFATNGPDALASARKQKPDLILLDVMMPGMSGFEVCQKLKDDLRTRDIPVIFITALTDFQDEQKGLEMGAVDYLHKPSHPAIVRQRVKVHLQLHNQNLALEAKVRDRTRALEESRIELVRRLGRAAEYRDNETGMHVIRMSYFSLMLAQATGVPESWAELLFVAAPMHDVGKIGIPDHILKKPGKLDDYERTTMKRHAEIGAEIIGDHDSELLRLAKSVALHHHEKWDGTGYPRGLAGDSIPLEGRIVALADVYDALTSVRPYKRAWSPEEAASYIESEAGTSFDPRLVPLFLKLLPEIRLISANYADD